MKKNILRFLILTGIVFITGCKNFYSTGIRFVLPSSSARSAINVEEIVYYNVQLTQKETKEDVYNFEKRSPGDTVEFLYISPGAYEIKIEAFGKNKKKLAEGTQDVVAVYGRTTEAVIKMYAYDGAEEPSSDDDKPENSEPAKGDTDDIPESDLPSKISAVYKFDSGLDYVLYGSFNPANIVITEYFTDKDTGKEKSQEGSFDDYMITCVSLMEESFGVLPIVIFNKENDKIKCDLPVKVCYKRPELKLNIVLNVENILDGSIEYPSDVKIPEYFVYDKVMDKDFSGLLKVKNFPISVTTADKILNNGKSYGISLAQVTKGACYNIVDNWASREKGSDEEMEDIYSQTWEYGVDFKHSVNDDVSKEFEYTVTLVDFTEILAGLWDDVSAEELDFGIGPKTFSVKYNAD